MRQVSVIRVLEYQGPEDWVDAVLKQNYIPPWPHVQAIGGEQGKKTIRELGQTKREIAS